METEYEALLRSKFHYPEATGFVADIRESFLSPFQQHATRWAIGRGRAALFEDTGLGKTRQQLAFADHVERHTGGRVIILAPLAVGGQTVREAAVIGIPGVRFCRRGEDAGDARIVVTNYDNLDHFDALHVAGVVLDESSILKSYQGKTKLALIERFKNTPYRLACTATPAPNDYLELGNHSDFLGILSSHQMLARWFINDLSQSGKYRLKGHAVTAFWDWVASWACMASLPSHLGPYDDSGYVLPALNLHRHVIRVDIRDNTDGGLFRMPDLSATGVHKEKRRTAIDRANAVAALVRAEPDEPWLVWVDTDYEADAVMRSLPAGAVEVSGSMNNDTKAERLLGFADRGGILVTKGKIAGFGMNWQHCARVADMGASYSYESFYQRVRRCWRFGQKRAVDVHVVMAVTEQHLWDVVSGKGAAHDEMRVQMIAASQRAQSRHANVNEYKPTHIAPVPAWFHSFEDAP